MKALPQVLLIHTGGTAAVDAVATADPGDLVGGDDLPVDLRRLSHHFVAEGLAERVGATAVRHHRVHLRPRDAAFAGDSGDIAFALAVLLAWARAGLSVLAAQDPDRRSALRDQLAAVRPLAPRPPGPTWTGSARLGADGTFAGVSGWAEKAGWLALLPREGPTTVWCAPADRDAATAALRAAGVAAAIRPVTTLTALAADVVQVVEAGLDLPPGALGAILDAPIPWTPEGWPEPSPAAAAWLARARRRADPAGYVGVEHLVAALRPDRSPVAAAFAAAPAALRLRREAESPLDRVPGVPFDERGTPRLVALAARLAAGFGVEAALDALRDDLALEFRDPRPGERWWFRPPPSPPEVAWSSGSTLREPGVGPRLVLQVRGGPEDGRVLELADGDTLGRWDQPARATRTLFDRAPAVDRRCSRCHLRWRGDTVEVLSGLRVGRGWSWDTLPPGAAVRVAPGDLIELTHRIAVRVGADG